LEDRRTSEENEVLLENLEMDLRSRDWTYNLEPGHTVQSVIGDFVTPEEIIKW
jgi:hypothetical protein